MGNKTAQSYCGDNMVLWTALGIMPVLRDSMSYLIVDIVEAIEAQALQGLLLLSTSPAPPDGPGC